MRRVTWSVSAALVMLAGCSSLQPMNYPPPATELSEQPGLFSGPDGEIELVSGPDGRRGKEKPQIQTSGR